MESPRLNILLLNVTFRMWSLNADPATGYSIFASDQGFTGWFPVGGTSAAAPLWAAFTGLVNSDLADNHTKKNSAPATVGFANTVIYQLALNPTDYARDFFDITTGNNLFFNAVTGFDDGSGWGAFNGSNLIADLTAASGGPASFPSITTLSPSSAPTGPTSVSVVITGTGFKAQAQAFWQTTALSTTVNSGTQLTVTVPSSLLQTLGKFPITVQNRDGLVSPAVQFTVATLAPTITALNPPNVAVGATGFTLDVIGTDFENGAVVNWNGTPLSTTFLTGTLITANVPTSDLVTAGFVPIVVLNPDTTQSTPENFEIDSPSPTLTSISPTTVAAGSGSFTITANGTNFSPNSSITWNGSQLTTTFVNSGEMTANVPGTLIASGGTAAVSAVSPAPGGGTSGVMTVTITFAPPSITSLSPSFTPAGTTGFTLTVNGTAFRNGSVVSWNGSPLTTTFVSAVRLTAAVPDADLTSVGTAQIAVTNPDNQTEPAVQFFITLPPPSVTTLAPQSATIGDSPVTLTVNGTNIQQGAVVMFGNIALSTSSVNLSGTAIVATIPTNALTPAGTVSVTVINPDHGTSGALTFTVSNPVPTIATLSPTNGDLGQGPFNITVTGTGLLPVSVVQWNSTSLATTFRCGKPNRSRSCGPGIDSRNCNCHRVQSYAWRWYKHTRDRIHNPKSNTCANRSQPVVRDSERSRCRGCPHWIWIRTRHFSPLGQFHNSNLAICVFCRGDRHDPAGRSGVDWHIPNFGDEYCSRRRYQRNC